MGNFLHDAWYVAADGAELTRKLMARRILNQPVVMFRNTHGEPVAMYDACPHKKLPLSLGTLDGDVLACGYHGLRFDMQGKCIEVPTQDKIPPRACVRTFPACDRHGFVWIWTGDPDKADPEMIPDFRPQLPYNIGSRTEADYPTYTGYKRVEGNFQLLIDNLLDLSHVGFVHQSTIGNAESTRQHASGKQESKGLIVSDWRMAHDVPAPPAFLALSDGKLERVDFWLDIHYHAPGALINVFGVTTPGQPREEGLSFEGFHMLTPETETSSHYYFGATFMQRGAPQQIIDMLQKAGDEAFDEDQVIVEAQQERLGVEGLDNVADVLLAADRAGVMARGLIRKLIKAENAKNASTATSSELEKV